MSLDVLKSIIQQAMDNSPDRVALWTEILRRLAPEEMCEVGVWKGEFAHALLSSLGTVEQYYFIDPWKSLPNWNKPANVSDIEFESIRAEALERNKAHAPIITELRDQTKIAATRIPDSSLDFAYIDGDHTLRGITIDLHAILPKIRPGGTIGGDDFTRNIWQHSDEFDPSEVFPYAVYFAEAHDLPIITLPFNQFLIAKLESGFEVVDLADYGSLTPRQIYSKPDEDGSRLRKLLSRASKKLVPR